MRQSKLTFVHFNFRTVIFISFLFILNSFFSATKTWNLTTGGSWATNGNWSPSGAPANGDDVIIPSISGGGNAITNVPTRTLNSITFTGAGLCALQAATSGNAITITTSWYIPSGFTLTIGASGARMVWTLASTCTATLDGYCAFDAGNTNRNFTVNGTLIVNAGGMLFDPNPSGGSDFYLTSGATLKTQKSQGITLTSATTAGNVNFNTAISFGGTYSYAAGANYEYNGTTGQITGAGLSQNIPASLTVNLSSGNTLTLTSTTTISGSLNLTSGKVNLNGNTLNLGTSAAATGLLTRTADFLFNGTFQRWFATTAIAIPSDNGLFPMGTSAGDYRPLWLGYSANLTTAGRISVVHSPTYPSTYISASHTDASWGNTLQGVSNSYWTITRNAFTLNGSTGMLRYGGTGFGTNVLTDLDASLVSSVTGSHSAATNVNTTLEVNRTIISTANITTNWYIGTKNTSASPLPITLIDFTAEPLGDIVRLNWRTATEKNSDFFTLEKSIDGIHFEEVRTIEAAGISSSEKYYQTIDEKPYSKINYYRLKETDFDGTYNYSRLISVYFNLINPEVIIYPNPSNGLFQTFVSSNLKDFNFLEIYNALAEKIYSSQDLNSLIDLSNCASGVYTLIIHLQDKSITKKVVIAH